MSDLTDLQLALREHAGPAPLARTASSFAARFIGETITLLEQLDATEIDRMATALSHVRDAGGRLFILGQRSSAGDAGEAANDFKEICGFEAIAPGARTESQSSDACLATWLQDRRINSRDALMIFSVGGDSLEQNASVNIVRALETADAAGAHIFGIVGRDGGFTREVAEACVIVPAITHERITPHTEGLCALVWHLLVNHPELQLAVAKWESAR